ncbi:endonuclease [Longibacter salinarum]|uniref:Endonuclease n=1 Tax=Longibacter salinarum TaxID=1850348 RepID=A0A2A8CV20_9BACT|nr:endonuclease/exonuclease/phosphatase family protein [Longibacter salinarum]PEN12310.1 endonuclease [Longibacter salinarum]
MARFLRTAGAVIVVLLLLFVGFWFWASSGTLPESERAQVNNYGSSTFPSDTVSVMTYNIGYLSGMTNNEPVEREKALYDRNLETAIELIETADPDIVAFQEIDFAAARSFGVHQLDTLAQRLSYPTAAKVVNWDVRYLPFPYGWPSVHFGQVISGQAVLSRYPIVKHERTVLAETSRPYVSRVFYLDRLAQQTDIVVGEDTLSVVNVHLEAFEDSVRRVQATEVRALLQPLVASQRPVLLIGDFNAIPDDPNDKTLQLATAGFDLKRAMPSVSSPSGTYPARDPKAMIDHIFYTPAHIEPIATAIHCGPADDPPSDHCAVSMRFALSSDSTAEMSTAP